MLLCRVAVGDVVEPPIDLCVEEWCCVALGLNVVGNRVGIMRFICSSDGDSVKQDAAESEVRGDQCQNHVKRFAGEV